MARSQHNGGELMDLSQFEIIDTIGSGYSATVQKARCKETGQLVALKKVKRPEKALQKMLAAEETFLRRLRGVNGVVQILPTEHTAHKGFIVLELLEGTFLRHVLQTEILRPLTATIELAIDLATAVRNIHRKGIVHRDISWTNVIVSEKRRVTVIDFGIAKFEDVPFTDEERESQTGTTFFMAPEVLRQYEPDQQSDLYALGILFFYLFGREPPFDGSPLEWMMWHINGPIPRFDRQVKTRDTRLEELVHLCLARDPANRPSSAEEVRTILRETLQTLQKTHELPAAQQPF